jgi:hypothetical protein
MQVLVNESELHAAGLAMAQLEALGHQVERCHDPEDEHGFPCVGLSTGDCPLERGEVDVALTVRGPSHPRPTPLEDGITCALRKRVPVVVAGRTTPNPFAAFGAVVAEPDVVGACERAAAARRADYEAVAAKALDWTLRYRDLPFATARAAVRRGGAGLHVTLSVPAETPKIVRDMAAVRVVGALRAFDPSARRIDITCEVSA